MEIQCFNCQKTLTLEEQFIARKEECPHCYSDLHSCRACHFYDTQSYNECRETMADRITEKEKSNFCDYFKIKNKFDNVNQEKEDLLSAADALFKK